MPINDDIVLMWNEVRESMKDDMAESLVNIFYGELDVVDFDGNTFYFEIRSQIKYNSLMKPKYKDFLEEQLSAYIGYEVDTSIEFTGDPEEYNRVREQTIATIKRTEEAERRRKASLPPMATAIPRDPNSPEMQGEPWENISPHIGGSLPPCNFEYTFDNFIVGGSNKFAHAACTAVAKNPSTDYNPLFIYGPSGIGKTHLLYAITNEIKKKKPDVRIIYIKGDDFTNQMIDSLSRQQMKEFHDKYRSCDMLLIDDVQFIAGKVATQEEFFHTFNTLYEEHKQIILTSDRPPCEIKTLEDRLKTRFEWGLIADIQPPDLELRIAIIKKKAEQVNITIPEDVLTYLAENLRSNIRQLEGAIKKLAALCFLSGKVITMQTAEGCITELLGGAEPVNVTVDKIFASIYKKYGISREQLASKSREKEIVAARHILNYVVRRATEMSYPNIGKLTNRNHATVIASMEAINKKIITTPGFDLEIRNIMREVTGDDSYIEG